MSELKQSSNRVWLAGKTAAASFAGPAGMAAASGLICAAAYGAAMIVAPEAAGGPWATMPGAMAGAAGLGSALAAASALPAAAAGFALAMKGSVGPRATTLKESLLDAWSNARELMIHGAVSVGALSVASWAEPVAGGGGLAGAVAGIAVCVPMSIIGVVAGLGGVGLAAKTAVDNTGAAWGSDKSLRERDERVMEESEPSLSAMLASHVASRLGAGLKLADWRQSKTKADPVEIGSAPQAPR